MSNTLPFSSAKRIVIKLGTQVVIEGGKLAEERLADLAASCAKLVASGKEIIIVSSGAVGMGRQKLQLDRKLTLTEKQACAAIGQSLLMDAYRELFEKHGLVTAQVLLTAMDFAERKHYLNLQQTFETLLKLKAIPIINENDTVSTMELRDEGYTKSFGDNDKLSALVAGKLGADLLVILTNVDGIFTDNPETNPDAKRIPSIEKFSELSGISTSGQSAMGRGGMASKLEAARIAAISGVYTHITNGANPNPLRALLEEMDEPPGTLIYPQAAMRGKKRWIGMASGYHGVVLVNEGARKALVEKQASLLPVGVSGVEGDFTAQQVVSIQDEHGAEIGRGVTRFSATDIRKIQGAPSAKIRELLGLNGAAGKGEKEEVIHRDNLVIFQEYST